MEKAKLDSLLLQTEGLLQAKQSIAERASGLRETLAGFEAMGKRWTAAREDGRIISRLLRQGLAPEDASKTRASVTRLLDFLESGRDWTREQHRRLASVERSMENDYRSVGAMVDALLDGAKRISMTPFSALFDILPGMVRNLLAEQGKEADLVVSGGDVEVDRRVLEEMKDPLIHLVRNCVDHGLEKPGERAARGKPPAGRISVSASHRDSGKVELSVADDGTGIDIAKVRTSAVRLGILSPDDAEKLDKEDMLPLVFRSGVTTSPFVTDISGRGLGLAIVQEKAERLGGTASAESSPESGTLFRMLLPVALATVRGLLVRLEEQFFVIPAAYVRRTVRAPSGDIAPVAGRETISVEGDTVPLVHLGRLLEMPPGGKDPVRPDFLYAVALESEEKVIAFVVDEILGEQEFLVKPLGKQLKRVRNVSGATVLGAGRVAPVLNVPDLMKSAVKGVEAVPFVVKAAKKPEQSRSLLVVEDSVTARILLKNILETAGI